MAKPDLANQTIKAESVISAPTQPAPEEYKGVWKNTVDGLLYELAALPAEKDSPDLKTHRLRVPPQAGGHPGLYWEGTKEQFKAIFEKP